MAEMQSLCAHLLSRFVPMRTNPSPHRLCFCILRTEFGSRREADIASRERTGFTPASSHCWDHGGRDLFNCQRCHVRGAVDETKVSAEYCICM
jgi:hypothetical protein